MAMERILGLDLGTASVGFALIDYDREAHKGEIVRMGVRVFPEALDAKTRVPLNQQRRNKRLVRRQTRRRKQRRRALNEYLHMCDLLPKYGTSAWHEIMTTDPYELRKAGLTTKLERHELGRAIYHLAKRRHFLGRNIETPESNTEGIDENASEDEDAKTTEDRIELLGELDRRGITLGEYLADIPSSERKRNKVASRGVVRREFKQIIEHQSIYKEYKDRDLIAMGEQMESIIFYQKPTFWRIKTLGTCRFVPDSRVCPSGSWIAYQRKMLEFINNMAIVGNNEPLTRKARQALVSACGEKDSMTWTAARKILKPIFENQDYEVDDLKFNLEDAGERKIPGNPIERKLKQIFGNSWQNHPSKEELRSSIHHDIYACDYEEVGNQRIAILNQSKREKNRRELVDALALKYDISQEEATQLTKLNVKTGWEPYSVEAIRSFNTELNKGIRMGELLNSPEYDGWRSKTFPNRIQLEGGGQKYMPTPKQPEEQNRLNRIRNPTVVRTSNELRKIINNLIRAYGRPDLIRVELARDLRNSKNRRDQISKNMKSNESRRETALIDLKENHIERPSREDVDKWLLWKECGCRCPYTGEHISFNSLFGPNPSFEIEHIWPRSRSLDDSMLNKTLCLSSANREKGNRTPYEYMGGDEAKWDHLTRRLEDNRRTSGNPNGMLPAKIARFYQKEIPSDFTNRQLIDTSYASKEAVASLERLWSTGERNRVRVQAVSGRATAKLRHLWGLDGLLGGKDFKSREDHRHHAVDALTIACIYPGTVGALLKEYYFEKESYAQKSRPRSLQMPWATIRDDACRNIAKIVVSHKVQRKVSGALHEETIYGNTSSEISKGGTAYSQYVTRKNLNDLTPKQRNSIRDRHIRKVVGQQKTKDLEIQIGVKGRVVKKVRVLVDRVPALMKTATTGFVEAGSNHHMEVFENSNSEVKYRVVSLMEAAARVHKREPIVDRKMPGFKFINSFSKGETIKIDTGEKKGYWVVKQVRSNGQLIFQHCNDARSGDSKTQVLRRIASTLVKMGYRKVSIDPIGNVRPAND